MTFLKMKKGNDSGNNANAGASVDGRQYTDMSSKKELEKKARLGAPPDGGWGWVVALSSFSISMLVDGVCFSFGIFFEDFRTEFKSSKATTSWIGSVLNGSYLIFGPIVSALVNIYGCRRVAMCGSLLASVAFFCSCYSNNIGLLIFSFGFIGGIGFGLMYLPAIVIVGYYFEKRRALATGIACCGSGIGAFLFAPFCEYLLNEYGWRGAIWIISGLVLNGFMFALFYRPLPGPVIEVVAVPTSSQSDATLVVKDELKDDEDESQLVLTSLTESEQSTKATNGKTVMRGQTNKKIQHPVLDVTNHGNSLGPSKQIYRTRSVTLSGPGRLADDDTSFRSDVLRITKSQDFSFAGDFSAKKKTEEPKQLELPPLQRKDIFYSGSIWHLKEFKEFGSIEEFRQEMISTNTSTMSPVSALDTSRVLTTTTMTMSKPSMREAIASVFDLALMKSPTFLVYGMSCVLCMAGFFVPFIYMPVHAVDLGLDARSAAFLISIIGITNTVGRVAVGFISDQPWADCLLINNVALMVGGAVTVFVPLFTHYYVLAIYSAVFGSSIAVFVSLRSIIMVELMGLEKLTTAFGFVIMFQGVSSFLGAPFAGALSDHTGNNNAAFYMAGITLFLSGVICLPLRQVARWEARRETKGQTKTTAQAKITGQAESAAPAKSKTQDSTMPKAHGANNSALVNQNTHERETSMKAKSGNGTAEEMELMLKK